MLPTDYFVFGVTTFINTEESNRVITFKINVKHQFLVIEYLISFFKAT